MKQSARAHAGDEGPTKVPAVTRTTTAALAGVGPAPVPAWRGRLHLVAALVAVPAGAVLVAQAPTGVRAAAAVHAITQIGVFAVSATKLRRLHVVGGKADFWYQGLGWLGALALPWLVGGLTAADLLLLVGGGLLYTGGAVVLGRKRPDPWPLVFGYHEVGHAIMLAGSICHYSVYLSLVQGT